MYACSDTCMSFSKWVDTRKHPTLQRKVCSSGPARRNSKRACPNALALHSTYPKHAMSDPDNCVLASGAVKIRSSGTCTGELTYLRSRSKTWKSDLLFVNSHTDMCIVLIEFRKLELIVGRH